MFLKCLISLNSATWNGCKVRAIAITTDCGESCRRLPDEVDVCRVSMGFRSKTVKIYENNTYNHGKNLQWVNLDDFKHTDEHTDTAIS